VEPHSRSGSFDASAPSSGRNVLTGKSSRYNVNNSLPRSTVKGLNVIPNRERRENAVILSGDKYASCVGFPFNGADCSPSEQVASEYAATSACEKCQLIHDFSGWFAAGKLDRFFEVEFSEGLENSTDFFDLSFPEARMISQFSALVGKI
jgi:hypothetical protein